MNKLFSLICVMTVLSSCTQKIIITDFSVLPRSASEIIDRVNSKNINYEHLDVKGSAILIRDTEEIKFNINIKVIKDSVAWMSIRERSLGIELFRAQLTTDSIYFINRLEKKYMIRPVSHLRDILSLDLNLYNLQNIFFSNIQVLKTPYELELKSDNYKLTNENLNYSINKKYNIVNVQMVNKKSIVEFLIKQHNENDNFPRKLIIKTFSDQNLEVSLTFSKVDFSRKPKCSFNIPNSYNAIP